MYALLNEHKNIWLNLHRSVPLIPVLVLVLRETVPLRCQYWERNWSVSWGMNSLRKRLCWSQWVQLLAWSCGRAVNWCGLCDVLCSGGENDAQDCKGGGVSCLSQAVERGAPPTDPATHRCDAHDCAGGCWGFCQLSGISHRCHHDDWKVRQSTVACWTASQSVSGTVANWKAITEYKLHMIDWTGCS